MLRFAQHAHTDRIWAILPLGSHIDTGAAVFATASSDRTIGVWRLEEPSPFEDDFGGGAAIAIAVVAAGGDEAWAAARSMGSPTS
mgnify:CR=1 FL=1